LDNIIPTVLSGIEKHYVYMVCCANGALYTGYSTDVPKRVDTHNAGRGARYTRSNRPVELVATWAFDSKSEALRAERTIKLLPHHQKLALAEAVDQVRCDFPKR
jgi:putative endonuclease